jgi:hypothetical protein
MTVADVLWSFYRRPVDTLLRRWNWKSAVLSSCSRATLFFATNLAAGFDAAVAASLTELVYRGVTAGFYGAMTQALSQASPPVAATIAAMVLLPAAGHSVEAAVHLARGTPALGVSLVASVAFTACSTLFNVFAMRRGTLIVGERGDSLMRDLVRMPGLIVSFGSALAAAGRRTAVGACQLVVRRPLRGA